MSSLNCSFQQVQQNHNKDRKFIYLQIPHVPSLMHHTDQQVLRAASFCFADQIQVCGVHSSTETNDLDQILTALHELKFKKGTLSKPHLISSTTRKTPEVYLKFLNLSALLGFQRPAQTVANFIHATTTTSLSELQVQSSKFYCPSGNGLLTEVPILSLETRSSSTKLWTTSFTDWLITPFLGPNFSSSLS